MRNFQHPYLVCNRHFPLSDLQILDDYPEDEPTQEIQEIHEYETRYELCFSHNIPETQLWEDLLSIRTTVNEERTLISQRPEYSSEAEFNSQKNAIAQSIRQLLPRAFLNSFQILPPNQWQHMNWQYEINDQPALNDTGHVIFDRTDLDGARIELYDGTHMVTYKWYVKEVKFAKEGQVELDVQQYLKFHVVYIGPFQLAIIHEPEHQTYPPLYYYDQRYRWRLSEKTPNAAPWRGLEQLRRILKRIHDLNTEIEQAIWQRKEIEQAILQKNEIEKAKLQNNEIEQAILQKNEIKKIRLQGALNEYYTSLTQRVPGIFLESFQVLHENKVEWRNIVWNYVCYPNGLDLQSGDMWHRISFHWDLEDRHFDEEESVQMTVISVEYNGRFLLLKIDQ